MLHAPLNRHRFDYLDLLRACLALYVMLIHALPWADAYQGADAVPTLLLQASWAAIRLFQNAGETNPAVLTFIVLSGYCIHRSGFRGGDVDVPRFAVRRFFRIYPVYLLAIGVGIVCWLISSEIDPTAAQNLSGSKEITLGCILARTVGIAAIYPPLSQCFAGNAPLSTVMVEIWLYAVYPVLFLMMLRSGELAVWRCIATAWVAGVIAVTLQPELRFWWNNASLAGFLAYWWIGAKALDPPFQAKLRENVPLVFGLWLTLSATLVLGGDQSPLLAETRKIAFALLIATLIVQLDSEAKAPRWLAALGRSGYSLYAFHAPIIYTLLILSLPWWAAVFAAIGVGLASYRWVERPAVELGRHLRTPR